MNWRAGDFVALLIGSEHRSVMPQSDERHAQSLGDGSDCLPIGGNAQNRAAVPVVLDEGLAPFFVDAAFRDQK